MNIKRLYLIGNGFDQHHGIESSYWKFRDWLKDTDHQFAEQMSFIFDLLPSKQKSWGSLEESLGEIPPDILDFGLSGIPIIMIGKGNESLVSFCTPFQEVGYTLRDVLDELLMQFTEWVESYSEPSGIEAICMNTKDSIFINFNYTHTLENLYHIPKSNIWHIHGELGDDKLIFGHNVSRDKYIEKWMKEYSGTKSALKKCASMLNSTRKPVASIISRNKNFWKKLREVEEVYVYGLSCSDVDMPYLETIREHVSPNAMWTFSWFKKFDDQRPDTCIEDYIAKCETARKLNILNPHLINLEKILFNLRMF